MMDPLSWLLRVDEKGDVFRVAIADGKYSETMRCLWEQAVWRTTYMWEDFAPLEEDRLNFSLEISHYDVLSNEEFYFCR